MIRCPRPGERSPLDVLKGNPKPSKGGLVDTLIKILTGVNKPGF